MESKTIKRRCLYDWKRKGEKRIKKAVNSINRILRDDSATDIILRTFKVSSVDELKMNLNLIENSNYDPDLARDLIEIDAHFFLNLYLALLRSTIKQLLKVQK